MKDIRTWLIIGLVAVIIFMLFFKGNRKEIINIQTASKEREAPHFDKLKELGKHVITLQHKMENDSAAAQKAKISYESTISSLKRKLAVAKFTGKPAGVSDDSVQLAMDCLKKQPYYDSISTTQEIRVVQLEKEKAELVKDYESIMDDNQKEKNELQIVINDKDKEIDELVKEARKANRKAKGNLIKGLILGGIVGAAGEAILK